MEHVSQARFSEAQSIVDDADSAGPSTGGSESPWLFLHQGSPFVLFQCRLREDHRRLVRSAHNVKRGVHFINEGAHPSANFLLCSGWAARYSILENGRRQVVELMLPGDLFPVYSTCDNRATDAIVALSDCVAATCPPPALHAALLDNPALARTFWWLTQRDKAILRAWISNLGQRDSYTRTAHLVCEMGARLEQAGIIHDGQFELPMTQEELSEAIGITSVHVNRVLRQMQREGLLEMRRMRARILDRKGLERAASFDEAYLYPS